MRDHSTCKIDSNVKNVLITDFSGGNLKFELDLIWYGSTDCTISPESGMQSNCLIYNDKIDLDNDQTDCL